jgi:uncharacterized membrane protein YgcG
MRYFLRILALLADHSRLRGRIFGAGRNPARLAPPGAASILPGGRIISPLGHQYVTGPGPFGLAISASGKTLASANSGPDRFSLTVLEQEKGGAWQVRQLVRPEERRNRRRASARGEKDDDQWHSVFMGLAFATEHTVYASEGNSGRVRLVDLATGGAKKIYDLNRDGFADSFTGDLAFDADRGVVYVLDQANFRLVAIDVRKQRVLSSVRLGRLPFALALSPDKRKAYVTNVGMFEYKPVPGVDRPQPARDRPAVSGFRIPVAGIARGRAPRDGQGSGGRAWFGRSQRAGSQFAGRGRSGRSGGAQD